MKKQHILVSALLFALAAYAQAADINKINNIIITTGPSLLPDGRTAIHAFCQGKKANINKLFGAFKLSNGTYTAHMRVVGKDGIVLEKVNLTGQDAQEFYEFLKRKRRGYMNYI